MMLGQEKIRIRLGPFRFIDHGWAVSETKRRLADLGIQLQDYESPVRGSPAGSGRPSQSLGPRSGATGW